MDNKSDVTRYKCEKSGFMLLEGGVKQVKVKKTMIILAFNDAFLME